jgi:hypothetical protein
MKVSRSTGRSPGGSLLAACTRSRARPEFKRAADELFDETDLLMAQEFLPTEFDWRVGVLAGEPLFLCQCCMACGHWQIVKHRADGSAREGGFRTFRILAGFAVTKRFCWLLSNGRVVYGGV